MTRGAYGLPVGLPALWPTIVTDRGPLVEGSLVTLHRECSTVEGRITYTQRPGPTVFVSPEFGRPGGSWWPVVDERRVHFALALGGGVEVTEEEAQLRDSLPDVMPYPEGGEVFLPDGFRVCATCDGIVLDSHPPESMAEDGTWTHDGTDPEAVAAG